MWGQLALQQRVRLPADRGYSVKGQGLLPSCGGGNLEGLTRAESVAFKCVWFSFSHTGAFALKEGSTQVRGAPVLYRGPALCLCRHLSSTQLQSKLHLPPVMVGPDLVHNCSTEWAGLEPSLGWDWESRRCACGN